MHQSPQRLKVAMIDPSLFTWPYDSALIEGFRANRHDVRLYTKYLTPGEQGYGQKGVVEIFYYGLTKPWAKRLPKKLFLALKGVSHIVSMVRLWLQLRQDRPDIIHVQWAPLPPVDRLFVPLLRTLAPVMFTVHDSSPFNNNPSSKLQSIGAIEIIKAFDRQIVYTDHALGQLVAYGGNPATIRRIEHGILDSGLGDISKRADKPRDEPVSILLFGKLKPYKGADILIRALAAMPASMRARCVVRVVGKAEMDVEPLFALARELDVESSIRWDLRFVDDSEMGQIFATADIMAIPYRAIDASGVLMVALGMGRPIVASRIGLFSELLEDEKQALLVLPEHPEALAAALARLIESPELRQRMGQAVEDLRLSIPNWQQIATKTENLYREALAARTPA